MSYSRRRVARDSVYEELRDAIVKWELAPGERLSEENLAERLGVSRTPVREALRRLEAERLVVRSASGLPSVASVSIEDAEHMFSVRTALEQVAVRDAAGRITDEDLVALDQALSAMAVAVEIGDLSLVTSYGREFHALIHQASGNLACISFLQQLQPHVDRYRTLTTSFDVARPIDALKDHRAITKALRKRDADLSAELVWKHTMAGREVASRALQRSAAGAHYLGPANPLNAPS